MINYLRYDVVPGNDQSSKHVISTITSSLKYWNLKTIYILCTSACNVHYNKICIPNELGGGFRGQFG